MKDVVIIPAFNRPEYLFVTITLIKSAIGYENLKYIFALDYGFDKQCQEIIEKYASELDYELFFPNGSKYGNQKQSYCLLEAYRLASQQAKDYIFLIEDDIFIGRSFFTSHYEIHAKEPNIFCSIASRLNNHANVKKPQNMNYDTYNKDIESLYQSWGVCFHKSKVIDYILPHANEQYYLTAESYIKKNFPNHFLNVVYSEQDGLIRRIIDTSGLAIAYPDYPRCFHAGIWSYHRNGENVSNKTLIEKIDIILNTCFDNEKMQKYNQYNDVFIAELQIENSIKKISL